MKSTSRNSDSTPRARSTARRLSSTPVQSLIPAIEAYGADFIITWNEVNRPISGYHSMETRSEVVFRKILPEEHPVISRLTDHKFAGSTPRRAQNYRFA